MATGDYLTKCSGLDSTLRGGVLPGGTKSVLDEALNDNDLMKPRTTWDKLKDDVVSLWSNYLGRSGLSKR